MTRTITRHFFGSPWRRNETQFLAEYSVGIIIDLRENVTLVTPQARMW